MNKKRIVVSIIVAIVVVLVTTATCFLFKVEKSKEESVEKKKETVTDSRGKGSGEKELSFSWNKRDKITKEDGDYTFHAYRSRDKKYSWIHQIEVRKKGTTQPLVIPEKIEDSTVAVIGWDMKEEVEDIEFYKTIFGVYVEACHGCDGKSEDCMNIPSIQFPNTIREILSSAFSGLDAVKKIELPKGLLKMGDDVFYACDALEEIVVPKEYEGALGDSNFRDCANLAKLIVDKDNGVYQSVDNILYSKDGNKLIWVPTNREKVEIREGTEVIHSGAFSYSRIREIHIPASVKKIEKAAFSQCPFVTNIIMSPDNPVYQQDGQSIFERESGRLTLCMVKDDKLTLSDQVKIISGDSMMLGGGDEEGLNQSQVSEVYGHIERADLPSSITCLEGYWEQFCENNQYSAQKIYFHMEEPPNYVAKENVDGNKVLTRQEIYVPIQSVGKYKKWDKEIKYIPFTDGKEKESHKYKYIKSKDCVEIQKYTGKEKNIEIPREIDGLKVVSIAKEAFMKSDIISVRFPNTIETIGEDAFAYCTKLQSIVIPDCVEEIEARAFFGCKSLETVELSNQLTVLHGKCFKHCENLQEIDIPESVRSIHKECFQGCKRLRRVGMPENLEDTQSGIFMDCTSLKSIVLPKGLSHLSGEFFKGCIKLESVDVKGKIIGLGFATFENCRSLRKLEPIEISECVYYNAFKNCVLLEATVKILPGCEEIADGAFENCPKIKVLNKENAAFISKKAFGK